jgi:hypothetical protein
VAERWVCVYAGRAGGHARAVLETREEARRFAERHARTMMLTEEPLNWEDSDDSSVLRTQLGDYLVVPISHWTRDVAGDKPRRR